MISVQAFSYTVYGPHKLLLYYTVTLKTGIYAKIRRDIIGFL